MRWREYQSLQRVSVLGDRFVSYVDQGSGEVVVLLHGIPTWGYLWHRLIPELAWRRRVLVPDLLGFGYSDKSDRFDRSIARQAEAIEAWLTSMRIDRADIVGHDIGGGVALRLATSYPHRVSRLCLISTVSYDSWPTEMMLQLGHPGARRKLSASAMVALLEVALRQGFASSPEEDLLDGILAPYATEVGKVSLVRCASALNTNLTLELAPLLPQIRMPTLILWGADDRFQRSKYGVRLAFDIPEARLVRIERARHFVMFDRLDRVAEELRMFFALTAAAAPRAEEGRLPPPVRQEG